MVALTAIFLNASLYADESELRREYKVLKASLENRGPKKWNGSNYRRSHENQTSTPKVADRSPKAFKRKPSKILPDPYEGVRPFSYARLVQPVLDAKCVECHAKSTDKKAMDLSRGEYMKNRDRFNASYINLKDYLSFYNDRVFTESSTMPGKFGAKNSKLYKILQGDHHKLKLTDDEMRRLSIWMDNNALFFGHEDDIDGQAQGKEIWASME